MSTILFGVLCIGFTLEVFFLIILVGYRRYLYYEEAAFKEQYKKLYEHNVILTKRCIELESAMSKKPKAKMHVIKNEF